MMRFLWFISPPKEQRIIEIGTGTFKTQGKQASTTASIVYVCSFVSMSLCMNVFVYVCIYIRMCLCMCVSIMYVFMYVPSSMSLSMYVLLYVHVPSCMYVIVCMYLRMYISMYVSLYGCKLSFRSPLSHSSALSSENVRRNCNPKSHPILASPPR